MITNKVFWGVAGAIIIVLASWIVRKSGQLDPIQTNSASWSVEETREKMAPDALLLTAWLVEDLGAGELPSIPDATDLATLYREAANQDDMLTQYRVLKQLAQQQGGDEILPYVIHAALAVHDFSGAFASMVTLQTQGKLLTYIRPTDFVYTLFNAIELHVKNLARIKKFVHDFARDGALTPEQSNYYDSLVAFTKGDTNHFQYFTNLLTWEYLPWKKTVEHINATMSWYKDPPAYYFDGLIALELFKAGYYQPVRVVAQRISKIDPQYILPRQLLAYASMHLMEWQTAIIALQQLKQLDPDNQQRYFFLEAVATRSAGNLPQSIALFAQVTDPEYAQDVMRYLLLLYEETGDTDRFLEQAEELATQSGLTVNDFYTLFDLVFFKPIRMQQPMSLFTEGYHTILLFLGRCKESIGEKYGYVCLYGKAGMFLAHGYQEKAYASLQKLVRRYPQPWLFQTLASLAKDLGDEKQAKLWRSKALFGGSAPHFKNEVLTFPSAQ